METTESQVQVPPVDVLNNEKDSNNKSSEPSTSSSSVGRNNNETPLRNILHDKTQEKESDTSLLSPFYENFTIRTGGSFQHFTLPRPRFISEEWCVDPQCNYNSKIVSSGSDSSAASGGSSTTSIAELISSSNNSNDSSGLRKPPSNSFGHHHHLQDCVPHSTAMNNYPYHHNGSTNSIYNNPYSYTTSSRGGGGGSEEIPYATIKQINGKMKGRHDNISPATISSNVTGSTALSSSSRSTTLKRQQQKQGGGDIGTIVRNGGTMSRSARAANASTLYYSGPDHLVVPIPVQACQGNVFCPNCNCNGPIPLTLNHLETIPELSSLKTDQTVWNLNNNNLHIPLKRNSSIGGFTITGQPRHIKKSKMSKFCSSHKIALVVSTFSLLVTIGLVITLLLMKKKGMMENM